ncbi:MAG: hypothetical protein HC769_35535 [Cyanobacteria bacterium CRU_2_1]|nr:hypothetical protein [Cyanobacteria bacterium CRU_2_1]
MHSFFQVIGESDSTQRAIDGGSGSRLFVACDSIQEALGAGVVGGDRECLNIRLS